MLQTCRCGKHAGRVSFRRGSLRHSSYMLHLYACFYPSYACAMQLQLRMYSQTIPHFQHLFLLRLIRIVLLLRRGPTAPG